jgi:hypothetical protein
MTLDPDTRMSRKQAVAQALRSTRLEGLDPGDAEPILMTWARGELSHEQLAEARRRLAAGKPVDESHTARSENATLEDDDGER